MSLIFCIGLFLARVSTLLIGSLNDDIYLTIKYYSIANSICYLILLLIICKISKIKIFSIIEITFNSLIKEFIYLIPLIFLRTVDLGYVMNILTMTIWITIMIIRLYLLIRERNLFNASSK